MIEYVSYIGITQHFPSPRGVFKYHRPDTQTCLRITKSVDISRMLHSKMQFQTCSSEGTFTYHSVKCGFSFTSNDFSKLIYSVLTPSFLVHVQVK